MDNNAITLYSPLYVRFVSNLVDVVTLLSFGINVS